MSRPVELRRDAEIDIEEAYVWYEERREGLGVEFLQAVEECLDQIEQRPELYAIAHREARRAQLRRFPYALTYVAEPNRIDVVACTHSRRDSWRWQSRL